MECSLLSNVNKILMHFLKLRLLNVITIVYCRCSRWFREFRHVHGCVCWYSGSDKSAAESVHSWWVPMRRWNMHRAESAMWPRIPLSRRHRRIPLWSVWSRNSLTVMLDRGFSPSLSSVECDLGLGWLHKLPSLSSGIIWYQSTLGDEHTIRQNWPVSMALSLRLVEGCLADSRMAQVGLYLYFC